MLLPPPQIKCLNLNPMSSGLDSCAVRSTVVVPVRKDTNIWLRNGLIVQSIHKTHTFQFEMKFSGELLKRETKPVRHHVLPDHLVRLQPSLPHSKARDPALGGDEATDSRPIVPHPLLLPQNPEDDHLVGMS